jgi:biotin transporter BioY
MERSTRIRLGLAAPTLGFLYFYLLVLLIGWMSSTHRPSWWFDIFPSRQVVAVVWLICLHTIGVVFAAVPIAIAVVAIARERAVLLGVIVGVVATTLTILPSLRPDIWQLAWSSHPIFFITDQIKLLVAVPLVAWIIQKIFSRDGLSPTALRKQV